MQNLSLIKKAKKIKLLILDVDGVLTDGSLYMGESQEHFKAFHVHDGLGLRLLLSTNVRIAIITARQSDIVTTRLNNLGISEIFQGVQNKFTIYNELMHKYDLESDQIAFVGDDLPDLQILTNCGLGVGVQNAHFLIKRSVKMITERDGGRGAVREVCDFIMQSQGTLDKAIASYKSFAIHD